MSKRVIIIQGPSTYVTRLKNAWSGYDIIWSTWVGDETHYDKDDIVIFNEKPLKNGVQNLGLQHKTTIEGVKKAKELGYDRVLKWRSDLEPKNTEKLLSLFDEDSLNFLAWHSVRGGYFIDYFIEGKTDYVYDSWDIKTFSGDYSEQITTKSILSKFNKFNFIGNKLNETNDIFWIKRNINLSTYNKFDEFKMVI